MGIGRGWCLSRRVRFPARLSRLSGNQTQPTMSGYNAEWKDVPRGYYADPEVKARHDRRVQEERRFSRLVEAELEKMGLDAELDIPTQNEIDLAEKRARRQF